VIEVSNLTRRFGANVAVDDLSFRLAAGEVVGFLGPNGAGKTTTMRMLAGYLPATRGSITIGGFDVLRQSLEARRRIGYLPESVPLYREHRVEEMLRFQARLHRVPRGERERRIGAVLERVGLTDRRRSLVGDLSRGLRQRAGLAVCLLPEPDVLILDEPTSGLDPLQRIEVRKLVAELARERTVLLSSHILAEVEALCPRVLIVHKGRCLADGRPDELVTKLGGGAAAVRVEAVVPDAAEARRLLASLPGVSDVEVGARVGIHHAFVVRGEGDLREDVGALAMAKRWALRELSSHRPSLENLFAALVLGEDPLARSTSLAGPAQAAVQRPRVEAPALIDLAAPARVGPAPAAPAAAPAAATTAAPARSAAMPMLNPFERAPAPAAAPAPAPPAPPAMRTLNPFERPPAPTSAPAPAPAPEPAAPTDADRPAPSTPPRQQFLNPFEGRGPARDQGEA
jgi:ABC-2 type transport system ATP-binding protein